MVNAPGSTGPVRNNGSHRGGNKKPVIDFPKGQHFQRKDRSGHRGAEDSPKPGSNSTGQENAGVRWSQPE
ncbi:hypothetical protein AA103587_2601 [Gluconobacter kanchanaburiensis NBRC 103587]|nr:hypothetical protein AA103587_2601 [Gluconobacter kanchanaburiensis NBRC 103587]